MDWNKLKAFHEVAINKSISKASNKLNISQSAISRQIQDLEFDLNTTLFTRHQKGVRLTEQGENLFETVNNINFSIYNFEQKLLDKKTKPAGKLTISTTILATENAQVTGPFTVDDSVTLTINDGGRLVVT